MKNKVYNNLLKFVSQVLVVAMIASVGFGISTNEAEAADVITTTVYDTVTYSKEPIDVTEYWTAEKKTAPVEVGYVFGGWYSEKNANSALSDADMQELLASDNKKAYAKWVPAQVLSVKAQVKAEDAGETVVDATSTTATIRMVSTVDSLAYNQVGFEISAVTSQGNGYWETYVTHRTKVYRYYNANNVEEKPENIFCEASEYFFAKGITQVPGATDFDTGFLATPYWVTPDGTKVTGLTKYVHVEDSYLNLVSVPVFMRTEDVKVMAGIVTVGYDKDALTYLPEKAESGKLFGECATAANEPGTVKCVANATTVTDQDANGMYINLRFKENNPATSGRNVYQFTVTAGEEDFCDSTETFKIVEVQDIYY